MSASYSAFTPVPLLEAELLPRSNRPPQHDEESTQIVNPKELALAAPPSRRSEPPKQTLGRPRLFQPSISEEEMTNLMPGKSLSERAGMLRSSAPPASPSRRGSFSPVSADPVRKEDSLLASLDDMIDDDDDDLKTEVRQPLSAPPSRNSSRPPAIATFSRPTASFTSTADSRSPSSRPSDRTASRTSDRPRSSHRPSTSPPPVSIPAHFALQANQSGQYGQLSEASDSRLDLQGVAGTLSVPAASPRRSWGSAFAVAGMFVAVVGVAMAGANRSSFHALSAFIDPSASMKTSTHTTTPVVVAPVAAAAQPVAVPPAEVGVPAVVLPQPPAATPVAAPVSAAAVEPAPQKVAPTKPAFVAARPAYIAPAPKPVAEAPKPKAVAAPKPIAAEDVKPKKGAKDDGSMKAAAEALSKAQLENSL